MDSDGNRELPKTVPEFDSLTPLRWKRHLPSHGAANPLLSFIAMSPELDCKWRTRSTTRMDTSFCIGCEALEHSARCTWQCLGDRFRLAKDEDLDLTATGDLVGTLRYMAPERFQGIADIRSDIFSLGLTLYELLTLRTCLPRADRSIGLRLDAPRDLPAPRSIDPQIPPNLETIVLKAIEYDPRQRYASAELMANDLRLFLADRPILARPVTRVERTWMWVRRNRLLAGITAVACFLLVLSCLGWLATHITRTQRDRRSRPRHLRWFTSIWRGPPTTPLAVSAVANGYGGNRASGQARARTGSAGRAARGCHHSPVYA